MPVHACKSTIKQVSPATIRSRLNVFSAGLFKKEPFPSQRIQLNPSKIPTKIGHSVVTEKKPSFERQGIAECKIRVGDGQPSI